jgi:cell division septal protein FtsQ
LERFVRAYPVTVGRARASISYVDLRYANGFAAQVKGAKLAQAKKGG